MHFVDETSLQVLTHCRYAATNANVLARGGFTCSRQRFVDSTGHEMKGGAARHLDGFPGMVREHEHGYVVRRIVAPPAFPVFIWPLAANRSEHVAAHDPCAHVDETAFPECIIRIDTPAGLAKYHLPKRLSVDEPFM